MSKPNRFYEMNEGGGGAAAVTTSQAMAAEPFEVSPL